MKPLVVFLFAISLAIVLCLQAFSNPNPTLPECFVEGQGGKVQDLTNLCGKEGGKTSPPKSTPAISIPPKVPTAPKASSNPYNKTRTGETVNLPSSWKVFPDGSISPSPGILVPSLYDID